MKLVFLLLILALFGSCKHPSEACLGDALYSEVAFNGTVTIVAGSSFEIPITHQFVGCEPLTAVFCSKLDIYYENSLIESQLFKVHFSNEYEVTDYIGVVFNEPGDYRIVVCPDVKNEVQVRNETSCQ